MDGNTTSGDARSESETGTEESVVNNSQDSEVNLNRKEDDGMEHESYSQEVVEVILRDSGNSWGPSEKEFTDTEQIEIESEGTNRLMNSNK